MSTGVWRSLVLALMLMLGLISHCCYASNPAQADARPAGTELALNWRIVGLEERRDPAQRVTVARLSLTNHGKAALPSSHWALYFTSIAGIESQPNGERFIAEQIAGTLFRLRPGPAFEKLGAGETASFDIVHPEEMAKTDKAPKGPYLAYDDAPEHATAIGRYEIIPGFPMSANFPANRNPEVGSAEIFERNASISRISAEELPPVFPTPLQVSRKLGVWRIEGMPVISGPRALTNEIARAKALFVMHGLTAPSHLASANVRLAVTKLAGQPSSEAYQLDIDPQAGITLSGNSPAGVSRGVESIRQLLPLPAMAAGAVELPAMQIIDAPRFGYRGVLLDVARNFQRKEAVFRLLELMAGFKLNRLHLHLTDDEGWRLAIRGLPELTGYGARRGHALNEDDHLLPAHGSGPRLDDEHGSGYYSPEDFIAILRFAAARHIEVIPELEMPGHARAAVKAMEYRAHNLRQRQRHDANDYLLSDPADKSRYRSAQLYTDNVINPGLKSSYRFIEHVIGEVARLYRQAGVPLRTLHVGGDELANGAWELSPACSALMQREKLASSADLWDHFYDRVARMVRKHGATVAGWEELGARKTLLRGEPKLIPNPLFTQRGFELTVWNNLEGSEDLAHRLANAGYKVVLAPATTLYFDMAHNRDPLEPGVNWAAYTDIDAVHDFVPLDSLRKAPGDPMPRPGLDGLTDYGKANVIGLEGTLFSEVMREPSHLEFLLMPRLLGLAERAWAADPAWARANQAGEAKKLHAQAWSRFVSQLGQQVLPRLDAEWPELHYRIPPPGVKRSGSQVLVNHQFPGIVLRYTIDGSAPTTSSPAVMGPIDTDRVVTVAAFSRNGRASRVSRSTPP